MKLIIQHTILILLLLSSLVSFSQRNADLLTKHRKQVAVASNKSEDSKNLTANFITLDRLGSAPMTVQFKDASEGQPTGWNWNFGDTTFSTKENPEKVFDQVREYEVKLKYTTSNECVDSVMLKVDVGQAEISIPNVFTPNGDGYNELFTIKDLEYYMSNELMIFNYQGNWDGDNLKDGVYFYVLKAKGYFGTDIFKGSISIMR